MTQGEMQNHMIELFKQCHELRSAGQKEYAHDTENAFRNFESVGIDLQMPREKVLWVYLKKHLDGIRAHLNGTVSQRESVHGRIKDAIVYLVLLDGMLYEDHMLNESVAIGREVNSQFDQSIFPRHMIDESSHFYRVRDGVDE